MNFLAVLLFPFTLLYDLVTRFRNYLYNTGYKQSFEFQANVISVGNLSVGGTGKSPMVEYIIRLLKGKRIVTLSRGYGRSTRGFRIATDADSPQTIGDEPYQFYNKFRNDGVCVTVGERRAIAIPFILAELPETDVILLDDAFQHRQVKPGLNILLTEYDKPFFEDHVLPSGRLRESRKGAQRADMIVVTKCPQEIDRNKYIDQIRPYNNQAHVAFAAIRYLDPQAVYKGSAFSENVFLFSGIANHTPFRNFVKGKYNLVGEHYFKDHYKYTLDDLQMLKRQLEQTGLDDVCLLTTEKDMVKLRAISTSDWRDLPVFYLPIETAFIEGGNKFDELVIGSLKKY